MSDEKSEATLLRKIVETMADNKFELGDRLAKIGISAPNIEASLSSIALAQGELGHARLLYNWAFDLSGQNQDKTDVKHQTGKAFASITQIRDWISLISTLHVVNLCSKVVLQSIYQSNPKGTGSRIHKLLIEQQEYMLYSEGWMYMLLTDRGSIPEKCRDHLHSSQKEAELWLTEVQEMQELFDHGLLSKGVHLVPEFQKLLKKTTSSRDMDHVS
jgi:ring-1,2-phenylacetyl-CoA epoxidase subunit PaaC